MTLVFWFWGVVWGFCGFFWFSGLAFRVFGLVDDLLVVLTWVFFGCVLPCLLSLRFLFPVVLGFGFCCGVLIV